MLGPVEKTNKTTKNQNHTEFFHFNLNFVQGKAYPKGSKVFSYKTTQKTPKHSAGTPKLFSIMSWKKINEDMQSRWAANA